MGFRPACSPTSPQLQPGSLGHGEHWWEGTEVCEGCACLEVGSIWHGAGLPTMISEVDRKRSCFAVPLSGPSRSWGADPGVLVVVVGGVLPGAGGDPLTGACTSGVLLFL